MTFPKYCSDCKHSAPEVNSEWNLRCLNKHVNARDEWALAATKIGKGTSCSSERARGYFSACGRRGAQWEQRAGSAPSAAETPGR